ncbi:MAG: anaerobic sulfatase maturase [Haloarculaceae archaeon]
MAEESRRGATAGDGALTRDEPFNVMAMPAGPACNLACDYCYYLEKTELYPETGDFRMSDETLETFVRQYVEAHPGPEVTFAWQGGEPTLRDLDFYRKAVRLQEKYAPPDKRVVNSIQTNGTRLDAEWCEFLAEEEFLVGISVDGPPELHDRFRATRGGGPTFDEVRDGLSLLQEHGVEHNVLCVVNGVNSRYPLRVYDFFRDLGVDWVQFIPLVEPLDDAAGDGATDPGTGDGDAAGADGPAPDLGPPRDRPTYGWVRDAGDPAEDADDDYDDVLAAARDAPVTDRSVDPDQYGAFMAAIFDEWVRTDVGSVSVKLFEEALQIAIRGRAGYCVLSETCGNQVAMEHSGDVYSCDHFVDPGFRLGNVHDDHLAAMLDSDDQRAFGEYKRDGLPDRCLECPVREFCHGGCPKNRLLATPDGQPGLNYLCAGYRRFFSHVGPYLGFFERAVDEGRPLGVVMDRVKARDRRAGR